MIGATPEVPSKYDNSKEVWVKLDNHTKWMPGQILTILLNQSYEVKLMDSRIFRRNEHHITVKWQGANRPNTSQQ